MNFNPLALLGLASLLVADVLPARSEDVDARLYAPEYCNNRFYGQNHKEAMSNAIAWTYRPGGVMESTTFEGRTISKGLAKGIAGARKMCPEYSKDNVPPEPHKF